jgi:hypothetical protein
MHIPTIELQRSKKRMGEWFTIQHPTIVTLTISKIGNLHMSQSKKIKSLQIKNFEVMHVNRFALTYKNKKHEMWIT